MVYFICRSEYELPHGRRIIEDSASDLVEWFQSNWVTRDDLAALAPDDYDESNFDPWDWQDDLNKLRAHAFGGGFYGLPEFLMKMLDQPRPQNLSDIRKFIASFEGRYSEGGISMVGSAIEANTNDDEIDIAWYLFDSAFADENPDRVAFLRRKEFSLPTTKGTGGWVPCTPVKTIPDVGMVGKDRSYFCIFSAQDGCTITDIEGCYVLPASLPEAPRWLISRDISARVVKSYGIRYITSDWPDELTLLRAFLLVSESKTIDEAFRLFQQCDRKLEGWLPRVFSDYRSKINDPAFLTGDEASCRKDLETLVAQSEADQRIVENGGAWEDRSTFQDSPHLTQAVFAEEGPDFYRPEETTGSACHWIFFDNYWASANRDLAEGILRYGRGTDLLNE